MERRLDKNIKLESQIREAFGRVVYSQTAHAKIVERKIKQDKNIKIIQIVLSGLTTGGFITAIILNENIASIVGAVLSAILFIFNNYIKNFSLIEEAKIHNEAANKLWKIREEYVSLLVDFENVNYNEIISRRDELQERTHEVYSTFPQTDRKSYLEAQKVLKYEEEQTFNEKEIDILLPNSVRRNKSN